MTVDKKMEEEIVNKFQRGLTLSVKESLYLFNKYIESLEQQPCEDWKFYYKHGYAQAKRDLLCEDCISRAEAIENFASWYGYDYDNQGYYRLLKQMPSVTPSYNGVKTELKPRTNLAETSQDTISREALRQKLQDHHDFFVNAYGNFRGMSLSDKARVDEIDNCIAMVVNAPSVTPEPKVGKWIKTYEPNDAEPCILWECSECKNVERGKRTRYCPNCGSYNGGGNE